MSGESDPKMVFDADASDASDPEVDASSIDSIASSSSE